MTAALGQDAAYRALVEHSMDAVLLTSPDGRIAMANHASMVMFGYAEEELRLLGREAVVDADDPRLAAALAVRRETGRFRGELTMKRKDGTRFEVELSSAVFRDDTGAEWTSMFIREITDRKAREAERIRAETAVRASERLLNGIFELLPVGVWIADPAGRIVRGNPAGIRIWAGARYVGPAQFGEYKAWWADSGTPIAADEWALARAVRNGETSIGEVIRIQCFDGSQKTIINSALPLYDEHGQLAGAIVVNEDITPLKESEAALRRAVEAREQVLEFVAHDLRQPLQVVLTSAQRVLLVGKCRRGEQGALHEIVDQVRRMDGLIADLLDVTQLEFGPFRLARGRVNPASVIDEAVQAQRRLVSAAGLDLRVEARGVLPDIEVDREKIGRVFANLIGNAVKFTPRGGAITLGAGPEDGRVRFWVADTGSGIDAASLTEMFTRRWQADAARRGTGLGLAVAKSIVDAHGGRIWAESTVGRGTTVSFTVASAG
jgi:PAS domain S-box-containing protein